MFLWPNVEHLCACFRQEEFQTMTCTALLIEPSRFNFPRGSRRRRLLIRIPCSGFTTLNPSRFNFPR